MGTGEAEGENRAITATDLALNNPLIDDYSLRGAKGLLVNITGGEDIKLFEVDQAVNKIRAEVDPEAELIFGAIKDENLNGKMRVSIVATALDGEGPESKSITSNVHRIHTRNSGYSEDVNSNINIPPVPDAGSIQGATALKLDEEVREENQNTLADTKIDKIENEELISGVSLENAAYFESNNGEIEKDINVFETKEVKDEEILKDNNQEEFTPPLFSDEVNLDTSSEGNINIDNDPLKNEEDTEFEIPAFLRKQKF
tara:strand:- start:10 stop:783 length:774 start_codon:yes stop_codon:yes gene_type:complete